MSREEHFRKLERVYRDAPCNRYYSPELRVSPGVSEVTIAVRDDFFHAARAVHGSVYFKALDDAAYFAVASLVEDVAILTVSFTVQFMLPAEAGALTARGSVVHAAERLFFAQATLTGADQRVLASGVGTFTKSRIALSEEIGYR